jgi:hypothetical protein
MLRTTHKAGSPLPLGQREHEEYVEHLRVCKRCQDAALGPVNEANKNKCAQGLQLWQRRESATALKHQYG